MCTVLGLFSTQTSNFPEFHMPVGYIMVAGLSYGLDRHDHKSRWQLAWIKFTVFPIKTEEAGPGFISVSAMGGYKQMTCQKHMPSPLGDDHTNSLLSLDPKTSANSKHMLKQINPNSIKYKYQHLYAKFANGSQMHLDRRKKSNN